MQTRTGSITVLGSRQARHQVGPSEPRLRWGKRPPNVFLQGDIFRLRNYFPLCSRFSLPVIAFTLPSLIALLFTIFSDDHFLQPQVVGRLIWLPARQIGSAVKCVIKWSTD